LGTIFPANHLTGAKIQIKPNQNATKLQHKKPNNNYNIQPGNRSVLFYSSWGPREAGLVTETSKIQQCSIFMQ